MVKIFIDPGHGGSDTGALGNGLQEKVLTLKIAKKIKEKLINYENVSVRLSREGDQTVSLKQRTDMANSWGADLLISPHINSASGRSGTGFESYIYNGSYSRKQNTKNIQRIIHSEIMKAVGNDIRDRGMKEANLHMVRESNMDSILTENLFINNPSDAALLKQDRFLDELATGHVNGLVRIFHLQLKEEEKVVNNEPSPWAKEVWERQVQNGYFDGTNPQGVMTREQGAALIERVISNLREYEIDPLKKRVEDLENQLSEE